MFKKSASVASAAAGLLRIGSPAFATADETEIYDISGNTSQFGLININELLDLDLGLCDLLDVGVGVLGQGNSQGHSSCIAEAESN